MVLIDPSEMSGGRDLGHVLTTKVRTEIINVIINRSVEVRILDLRKSIVYETTKTRTIVHNIWSTVECTEKKLGKPY